MISQLSDLELFALMQRETGCAEAVNHALITIRE